MSSIIAGMEHVANNHGYSLLISQSSEKAAKEIASAKMMVNTRVDGLLVSLAYDTADLSHFNNFFRKNITVIFFDRVMEHESTTGILVDYRQIGNTATKHLNEQYCKRIVHITALPMQNVYKGWLKGYKDALADGKMRYKEENFLITNLSEKAGTGVAASI